MLAIIGGSGLTQLANLDVTRREVARTPYGDTSGALTFGHIGGQQVVFIARHGYGHTIPPHLVNYRANIWALSRVANAEKIVSVASVGAIRPDFTPGAVVVPHQIIDYTHSRNNSFFEGGDSQVVHVDFTHPYDVKLRVPYAAVCVVANWAAGQAASREGIVFGNIEDVLRKSLVRVRAILEKLCLDGYAT